jgi:thiamine-phosphate pyrophosphorylase
VTDRRRLAGQAADERQAFECVLRQAKHAIEAGIDVIQIRERDLDGAALATLVGAVVALARGSRTKVVVNDRLDIALTAGAAGVHLPADSLPPAGVRAIVPSGFIVGRSVHSVDEALGIAGNADYLIAGTIWPSESKPAHAPLLGLTGVAAIAHAVSVPVLAIGGVTTERFELIRDTGASGVAGIGLFMGTPASGCRAIELRRKLEAAVARFDTSRAPT